MLPSSANIEIINPAFLEILQKYMKQGAIAADDFKFVGITMSEAGSISNGGFWDDYEEEDDEDETLCVIAINNFMDEPHWDYGPDSVEDTMRCVFQLIEDEYSIKNEQLWETCKAEIRANADRINDSYELIDWNSECSDPFEGWSFNFYYDKDGGDGESEWTDEEWDEEFDEDSFFEDEEDSFSDDEEDWKHTYIPATKDNPGEDFEAYRDSYECKKDGAVPTIEEALVPVSDGKVKPAAFLRCTELKSVVLEDGITRIGNLAFSGCASLGEILVPGSVKTIGNRAFAPCRAGYYRVVPREEADNNYKSSYEVTWRGTERIVRELLIEQVACESLENVTLEEGLESIGHSAFLGCSGLKEIILPSTVKRIGADAFRDCASLTKVVLSPAMKEIPDGAFANCRSLQTIEIPASVNKIGAHAFEGCEVLSEAVIHGDNVEIGEMAFAGIVNLRKVRVDGTVKSVGREAFSRSGVEEFGCKGIEQIDNGAFEKSGLKQLPNLSKTKVIGEAVFRGCEQLREVYIPGQVKKLKDSVFSGCVNLERVELGEGFEEIHGSVFFECKSLKTVVLPNSLIYIGSRFFGGCTELEQIDFPVNLESISEAAFKGCTALKRVTLPEGVSGLYKEAFADCASLEKVRIESKEISIFERAFAGCSSMRKMEVTGRIKRVGADAFKGCGQLKDIDGDPKRVWMLQDELHGVVRPNPLVIPARPKTVTSEYVVQYDRFDSVDISEGVEEIEDGAFHGSRVLKRVRIPGTVKNIGEGAFANCPVLSEVIIGEGVQCIGEEAFEECPSLREITIPGSVKTIPRHLFRRCHLEKVVLCDGVKTIENDALENVEWIEIPKSVKVIETFGIAMGATIVVYDYNREMINAAQRLRLRVLLRKDGVDTEINDYTDLWDDGWSMIDPKRLERAHGLSVRQLDENRFLVSGGRDDHIVTRLPQNIECDCSDYQKGTENCKHVLRVRLMKEDLDDFMAHGGKRIFW